MKNLRILRKLRVGMVIAASLVCAAQTSARNFPQATTSPQRDAAVNAQAWFQKGQAALANGDLAAAEEAFQRVLSVDPNAGAAYANLGVVAMRRKQWDEALKDLRKAAKLSPKVAGIRLNIGLVEFRRGDYELAIAPFEFVVKAQ